MNTISFLKPDDYEQVYAIELRCHAFPWSKATLASNQGERYINLRLDVDNTLAAFAIVQRVLDEASLFNIAVDPHYQRQGLAQQLLEHIINELEGQGVRTFWLEVRASNLGAIALYEKLGFSEVTIRRNYYPTHGGQEDAIVMALPLAF